MDSADEECYQLDRVDRKPSALSNTKQIRYSGTTRSTTSVSDYDCCNEVPSGDIGVSDDEFDLGDRDLVFIGTRFVDIPFWHLILSQAFW